MNEKAIPLAIQAIRDLDKAALSKSLPKIFEAIVKCQRALHMLDENGEGEDLIKQNASVGPFSHHLDDPQNSSWFQ